MALVGFEADDGAINRVQVLPFNHNLGTPAIQTNNWLFWANEQKWVSDEKITSSPVKTTVGQDSCDLWVFFIIKHLGSEDGGLVDKDAQRDIPDLWDVLGQTNDGGHVAFRLCDSTER